MSKKQNTPCEAIIYAIATLDTKQEEIVFVANAIKKLQANVVIVDVGTTQVGQNNQAELFGFPLIDANVVAELCPQGAGFFDPVKNIEIDRGKAVAAMSQALASLLIRDFAEGKFSAVIGIGGGGGTSLISHWIAPT